MAKRTFISFFIVYILIQGVLSGSSSGNAFQHWLNDNDPTKLPTVRATTVCTTLPDNSYPLDYPDDLCKSAFIICFKGSLFNTMCDPSTLVYDASVGMCTNLTDARSDACLLTPLPPADCSTLTKFPQYFATGICNQQYTACLATTPATGYNFTCPSTDTFNATTGSCGPCSITNFPTTPITTPTPAALTYDCVGKLTDGTTKYGLEQCGSYFFTCDATGTPSPPMQCPAATPIFNLGTSACSTKDVSATCPTTIPMTTAAVVTTAQTQAPTFKCPTAAGNYPIPGSTCCVNYYSCSSSVYTKKTCPTSYVFDTTKNTCISQTASTCKPVVTC